MTQDKINELKGKFKTRYEKSEIYHPLYVDWFPDDVINFMLSHIETLLKERDEAEGKELNEAIKKCANVINFNHTIPLSLQNTASSLIIAKQELDRNNYIKILEDEIIKLRKLIKQ